MSYRVGMGVDVHRIEQCSNNNSEIVICGIRIPCCYKVIAHSDGDVAIHALVDSILGACGSGDIGEHFPSDDKKYKDVDSSIFLEYALDICKSRSGKIVNVDINLISEVIRFDKSKKLMKENIAKLMNLNIENISVKAGTSEKTGAIGRGECILAYSVILVEFL